MNSDPIETNWDKMSEMLQAEWSELTDDDIADVKGNREGLIARIQKRYGIPREEAERQVDRWARNV